MTKALGDDEFLEVMEEFRDLTDSQLIALKGHALSEFGLRRLLATRLATTPDGLPSLSFASLARLALAGLPRARTLSDGLGKLANLRNTYAHELRPRDDGRLIQELTTSVTHQAWPSAVADQVLLFKSAIETLVIALLEADIEVQLSPEDWAKLEQGLAEKARQTVARLTRSHE